MLKKQDRVRLLRKRKNSKKLRGCQYDSPVQLVEEVNFFKKEQTLNPHPLNLCERSVAHLPDALWAFTFRHPCLPSPSEKGGSKAKLLKISR